MEILWKQSMIVKVKKSMSIAGIATNWVKNTPVAIWLKNVEHVKVGVMEACAVDEKWPSVIM